MTEYRVFLDVPIQRPFRFTNSATVIPTEEQSYYPDEKESCGRL